MTTFGGRRECGREMPFILSVKDAPGNELRIIAALPVIGEKGTHLGDIENSVLKEILKESHPVFPNREHPYEIIFPATSCAKCGCPQAGSALGDGADVDTAMERRVTPHRLRI